MADLEQLRLLDLDVATEFLLIAAVLLELKARRLLPGRDDVELDEELALWEERDLLLARLLECKTFKDAAASRQPDDGRRRPLLAPPGRAWRSASCAWLPTCWPASRPAAVHSGLRHGHRRRDRCPTSSSTTWPRSGHQRGRRRGRAARRAAPGRPHHLSPPDRGRWSTGWRSSCASWPSSSCTSRALVDLEQAANFAELHIIWLGAGAEGGAEAPGRPGRHFAVDEYEG